MSVTNSNSAQKTYDRGTWLAPILVCGLCMGQVWAQDAGKKSRPIQLQATAVSAPSSPANPVADTKPAENDSFVIGADDVLAINVWKEPDVSRSVPVRSDGKITLPLVGELQAGGQTPNNFRRPSLPGFKPSSRNLK